jgi:AraC-like DNA-binding protein
MGKHPCHFYDEKIISKAKELLKNKEVSIAQISLSLTYDPSNFSKFFKKWTGMTPGQFRKQCNDFRNYSNIRKVHHALITVNFHICIVNN